MSKLLVSWSNRDSCEDCSHQVERDLTNTVLYICIGYFIYPTLDQSPLWCWFFNLLFIFVAWQVFKFTCKKCIWECKCDLIKLTLFTVIAHLSYPYLECWPGLWWIFHGFYMYSMGDVFYLAIHQKSPMVPACMAIAWKLFQGMTNEAPTDFHKWAKDNRYKGRA